MNQQQYIHELSLQLKKLPPNEIKEIIADQLGLHEEDVKNDANFVDDLGADSLDIVELIMAMEEEFEVEIPDEEAENIKTVGDAINYINTHKK